MRTKKLPGAIYAKFSEEMYEEIKARAEYEGRSLSNFIRWVVRDYLKRVNRDIPRNGVETADIIRERR